LNFESRSPFGSSIKTNLTGILNNTDLKVIVPRPNSAAPSEAQERNYFRSYSAVPTQTKRDLMTVEGISEPVIFQYFDSLNAGDFDATAHLFASDGAMHAPFESPIIGRDAIAHYLNSEAKGMRLNPIEGKANALEDGGIKIQIKGNVQTSLFGVNVAWQFLLNSERKIVSVEVKLLASLEELAKFRR
jgi:hypothetical protein